MEYQELLNFFGNLKKQPLLCLSILIEIDLIILQYFEWLVICYVSFGQVFFFFLLIDQSVVFFLLQNRVKVRGKRRPQTRAARRLAAQESSEAEDMGVPRGSIVQLADGTISPDGYQPQPRAAGGKESSEEAPSAATLTWTGGLVPGVDRNPSGKSLGQPLGDDLFHSGDIFSKDTESHSMGRRKAKAKAAESPANPPGGSKENSPMFPALGEAGSGGDLFQSIKPKPAKKTNPFPLLEGEDCLFPDQKDKRNESKFNGQQVVISEAQDIFEVIEYNSMFLCLVLYEGKYHLAHLSHKLH